MSRSTWFAIWIAGLLLTVGPRKMFAQPSSASSASPLAGGAESEAFLPDSLGGSHAAAELRLSGESSDTWLFPITELDESLPRWIRFGGQFRDRVEGQTGLHFAPVDDAYDLTQLRLGIYIQMAKSCWSHPRLPRAFQPSRRQRASLPEHLGHS